MGVQAEDTGQNSVTTVAVAVGPTVKKQKHKKRMGLCDILLHGLFSFVFSCSLGLLLTHASMLWHQYQNGHGSWTSTNIINNIYFLEQEMAKFSNQQQDIFEWNEGQLKVNTSLYAW